MNKNNLRIALMAASGLILGCAEMSPPPPLPTPEPVSRASQPIRITAVGYGAENEFSNDSAARKKIMAIHAAKLDAYRALAEQIYGVYVSGHTHMSGGASQVDSARSYIDSFVRGARVLEITPQADHVYEVTLEASFDNYFFDCLNGVRRSGCPAVGTAPYQPAVVRQP